MVLHRQKIGKERMKIVAAREDIWLQSIQTKKTILFPLYFLILLFGLDWLKVKKEVKGIGQIIPRMTMIIGMKEVINYQS